MKKRFFLCTVAILFFLTGCKTKIYLTLNKDGSLSANFSGSIESAFEDLIRKSQGLNDSQLIFDTEEIKNALTSGGFSSVEADSKTGKDLQIKMNDKKLTSLFFSSGLLSARNNKLTINLSPENLVNFYTLSDQQIVLYLDMLLSPVFNNEEMSLEDYHETLSSFYGQDVAEELFNTEIELSISNPNGKTSKHTLNLAEILTLNKSFQLE